MVQFWAEVLWYSLASLRTAPALGENENIAGRWPCDTRPIRPRGDVLRQIAHSSRHGSRCNVSSRSTDWRKVYASARVELDPARQAELCKQARRLVQHRLVELASLDGIVGERNELEEALRDLFVIELGIQKPDLQ